MGMWYLLKGQTSNTKWTNRYFNLKDLLLSNTDVFDTAPDSDLSILNILSYDSCPVVKDAVVSPTCALQNQIVASRKNLTSSIFTRKESNGRNVVCEGCGIAGGGVGGIVDEVLLWDV